MRFRTEIEPARPGWEIDHSTPLLFLGSCFADEIGGRLENDGFNVLRNPLGPLYNPASILTCIERATGERYTASDLTEGPRGFHCLDYASRYSGADPAEVLDMVNNDLQRITDFLALNPVVFITLGSSFVYRYIARNAIVGNCHKLPDSQFERSMLDCEAVTDCLDRIHATLTATGARRIVFTLSPIRHLAYGLHGNALSKSTLLVAIDRHMRRNSVDYFPAYEIMLDDLRDYRFYAADMKHPSEVAADYIYEFFSATYFSRGTAEAALKARKAHLASLHRTIL